MRKIVPIFLFIFCFANLSKAQNVSNLGTDFWFGFMQNYSGGGALTVRITCDKSTKGILEIPLKNYKKAFSVAAKKPAIITIPNSYFANGTGKSNTGIHVSVEDSVTVFASNFEDATWDATVVLPTPSLGKNYYAIAYTASNHLGPSPSEILLVACEDNTQIAIVPPTAAGLQPSSVTLNKGQTYQLQHTIDLTGTYVVSENCKNFAFYSGDVCITVPTSCAACDHIYEQMYPINTWGKTFLPAPFANASLNTFRLITSEDSTNIKINDGVSPPQNIFLALAGSNYEFNIASAVMITADRPIGLAQYAQGTVCATIGDPFMLWVSPIEQKRDDIIFVNMPSQRITEHYANVVIQTKFKDQLTLNGQKVADGLFSTFVIDNTYSYAGILVDEGYNRLHADSGFNAYIYGLGKRNPYGYSAGSNLNNLNLAVKVESKPIITPNKFCINQDVEFSYTVRKKPNSILWEFGDGTNSTDLKPKHKFTKSGKYTVSIKAFYNQVGCVNFDSVGTTVEVVEPFVNFDYSKQDFTCNFAGLCNLDVSKWEWDFGDRSPINFEQNPSYTYLQLGTYTVQLIATTTCGKDTISYELVLDGNSGSGTTGLNEDASKAKLLDVFPNPFTEEFKVKISALKQLNADVTVFDVLGKQVYTKEFKGLNKGKHELTIRPENLISDGVYFVQVELDNELFRYKLNYIR